MSYTYEHVTLLRVIDGDTIQVSIDVGFRFQTTQILRLLELDTPERGRAGFLDAKAKISQLLTGHALLVTTVKQDSFGRWLSLASAGGSDVSRLMREWMAEQPWVVP